MSPQDEESLFHLDTNLDKMDGIIYPAILSNDRSSPSSGFSSLSHSDSDSSAKFNNPSNSFLPGRQLRSVFHQPEGWSAPESWSVAAHEGADSLGEAESGWDEGATQHKIRIRIYKADNTYHVVSMSTNVTVARLRPKLDRTLVFGEEREMHQLYLKEWGTGEFLVWVCEKTCY